jgi:hypothetical protein
MEVTGYFTLQLPNPCQGTPVHGASLAVVVVTTLTTLQVVPKQLPSSITIKELYLQATLHLQCGAWAQGQHTWPKLRIVHTRRLLVTRLHFQMHLCLRQWNKVMYISVITKKISPTSEVCTRQTSQESVLMSITHMDLPSAMQILSCDTQTCVYLIHCLQFIAV